MMKQYFEIKEKHKDYILFYRLGDFYEMFYEDAEIASKVLDITLTKRNAGKGERAPLCGVPYHSALQYIKTLVEKGFNVALCEQTEDPKKTKDLVKREVVKLYTAGTLVDPEMMDKDSNNYLLAIKLFEKKTHLSYCDLSTGHMSFCSFDNASKNRVLDKIALLSPREILIEKRSHFLKDLKYFINQQENKIKISYVNMRRTTVQNLKKELEGFFEVADLEGFGLKEDLDENIITISMLIDYINLSMKNSNLIFSSLSHDRHGDTMHLDAYSLNSLEILSTMRSKNKKGSLLNLVDKTRTSLGARLLKSWITAPLLDIEKINIRLDFVEFFRKNTKIKEEIKTILKNIFDLERLVIKTALGNPNPRDLKSISLSLDELPKLINLLKGTELENLLNLNDLKIDSFLSRNLREAIVENPPIIMKNGGYINKNYDNNLFRLKELLDNSKKIMQDIVDEEIEKTGIKTLKMKYNKVFGYFIEVSKGQIDNVPDYYIRKQTLVNAERYIVPKLKELEEEVLGANEKIIELEEKIFKNLVEILKENSKMILKASEIIASIDVFISFADLSLEQNYIRPEFNLCKKIELENSRHPVVESVLADEDFVPNDLKLGDKALVKIITGPNMAGKSTYLRQVALINLMAQIGSYVPASKASLPIIDRIFTRVGASDDLYKAQSTFMVEMIELANILNHASENSLIILDEIGRGTSTFDGLSIAWSVVEYIINKIKAKTMFATHYHELTELENSYDNVVNFRIDAREKKDNIIFLRKLVRGRAEKSFGIEVAKLAGVPSEMTDRARQILSILESGHKLGLDKSGNKEKIDFLKVEEEKFFYLEKKAKKTEELETIINKIDIDKCSPIDALLKLKELKDLIRN